MYYSLLCSCRSFRPMFNPPSAFLHLLRRIEIAWLFSMLFNGQYQIKTRKHLHKWPIKPNYSYTHTHAYAVSIQITKPGFSLLNLPSFCQHVTVAFCFVMCFNPTKSRVFMSNMGRYTPLHSYFVHPEKPRRLQESRWTCCHTIWPTETTGNSLVGY